MQAKKRRLEQQEFHDFCAANGVQGILTDAEITNVCSRVLQDSKSVFSVFDNAPASGYIGITKQVDLWDEALRWLTKRGGIRTKIDGTWEYTGQAQTPVLTWADGSTITQKQAREQLGFQVVELWRNLYYNNSARVEAALQSHFHARLQLGERLWRIVGAGANGYVKDLDKLYTEKVTKVFFTYSTKVREFIDDGRVIVQARSSILNNHHVIDLECDSSDSD